MISNYSIIEDLSCTPCKLTEDGFCLRNENNYCPNGECNCPHLISEIKVVATVLNCETTQEVCDACKENLTEPKTDCR